MCALFCSKPLSKQNIFVLLPVMIFILRTRSKAHLWHVKYFFYPREFHLFYTSVQVTAVHDFGLFILYLQKLNILTSIYTLTQRREGIKLKRRTEIDRCGKTFRLMIDIIDPSCIIRMNLDISDRL